MLGNLNTKLNFISWLLSWINTNNSYTVSLAISFSNIFFCYLNRRIGIIVAVFISYCWIRFWYGFGIFVTTLNYLGKEILTSFIIHQNNLELALFINNFIKECFNFWLGTTSFCIVSNTICQSNNIICILYRIIYSNLICFRLMRSFISKNYC
jgi:hypothetical protein